MVGVKLPYEGKQHKSKLLNIEQPNALLADNSHNVEDQDEYTT